MTENQGLYLDDIRTPTEHPPYIDGWEVVRNYEEFRDVLYEYIRAFKKLPKLISLDHDLANEHYTFHSMNPVGAMPTYEEFTEKTGMHCAVLITNICDKNNLIPERICIHSMNPVGTQNMIFWLNNWMKMKGLDTYAFTMKFKHTTKDDTASHTNT